MFELSTSQIPCMDEFAPLPKKEACWTQDMGFIGSRFTEKPSHYCGENFDAKKSVLHISFYNAEFGCHILSVKAD